VKQYSPQAPEPELMDEAKISTLLETPMHKHFEAGGVCVKDGICYVIIDNIVFLARFELNSSRLSCHIEIRTLHSFESGYEVIAYDLWIAS
jgi:hypothetical protein